ncbi:MAG: hypothetical protein WCI53_12390 [Bacteroidota bacterium]
MKLKTTIITFLIACNSLLAQNSDLFYKKTETKQVPTSNATSKNAILTGGQKPFHLNLGDARAIGIGYKINIGKDFSFGPGIHFGVLNDGFESINLFKVSGLFRYRPKNAYLKFGPYFTMPISGGFVYDFEDIIETPGFAIGGGYEFMKGFDIGLTENIDLFLMDFDDPLALLPTISLSYHFGEPKYTQNAKPSNNQNQPTLNYNLAPIESNSPAPAEAPTTTKTNYSKYSDEELKKLLEQATKAEKYNEANDIQAEITKRAEQNKYAKLSTEELKKLLEAALKAEDYTKAEALQKEIDKRTGQKKDKTTPDNSSKQPAKKSVKDLEEDLKKAMDAEDYKKADEIQKEINKLKKP